MEDFKWMLRRYRAAAQIQSDSKLCSKSGISMRTLQNRYDDNGNALTLFQLRNLDEVLNFSNEDLLTIVRGNFKK